MRRLAPLAVAVLAAGCSGGDDPSSSGPPGTVAIGRLPVGPVEAVEEVPATSLPPPTSPATIAPPTTVTTASTVPSTTAADAGTSFAAELADVVGGPPRSASPSEIVIDDTRRLRLRLPVGWDDRRTTPADGVDGERPSIAASPDLVEFLDGYDAPGMTVLVVDEPPATALFAYTFDEDCERVEQGRYRGEALEGEYRSWRSCGGTDTALVAVAATTGGGDTVLVLAQVLEPADLAALDVALASVRVIG